MKILSLSFGLAAIAVISVQAHPLASYESTGSKLQSRADPHEREAPHECDQDLNVAADATTSLVYLWLGATFKYIKPQFETFQASLQQLYNALLSAQTDGNVTKVESALVEVQKEGLAIEISTPSPITAFIVLRSQLQNNVQNAINCLESPRNENDKM